MLVKKKIPTISKPITLNEEQQAVVSARSGYFQVLAGPGAGKSACLVSRFSQLIQEGVNPDDLLSLTFTKTAAKNLRDRVEEQVGKITTTRTAGAVTFHSLGLSFAQEERHEFGFELADHPLAAEPVANKLSGAAARRFEVDPRGLRAVVSVWKRKRLRPAALVKEFENKLDVKSLRLALAYKEYEKKCRDEGVLDFDSLIFEMVDILDRKPEVRKRWGRKFVMCDESQDCSKIEWDLLKLLSQDHGNLLCVGDVSQCQPPDTMVAIKAKCVRHCKSFPLIEKPISELQNGDTVVSWSRKHKRMFVAPRKIEIASRFYHGPLLTIHANGKKTRVTPDHQVLVRYAPHNRDKYNVYLMWKSGWGFRVGMTAVKAQSGSTGINTRTTTQDADRTWVLKTCESKEEALHYEELFSTQFNVPEKQFPFPDDKCSDEDRGRAREIFDCNNNTENGLRCLDSFGLLFDHALYDKEKTSRLVHAHGFFKTAAANILPGLMNIPLPGEQSSALITDLTREIYEGPVYSLNVDVDHTYSADGLVVSNCIYGFRGSDAKLFSNMKDMFPETKTLFLATNYRSTPEIIDFIRPIASSRELAEKFHTQNASGPTPLVKGFLNPVEEAAFVIKSIKEGLSV